MALVHYCEICKELLKDEPVFVEETYEEICKEYATTGRPSALLSSPENTPLLNIIRLLERKGFVVSTESDQVTILVLPKGVNITDDGLVICPAYTHLGERFGQK